MIVREGSPLGRVMQHGVGAASALDLFSVALTRDPADTAANEQSAAALMKRYTLFQLGDVSPAELRDGCGLEEFEATRFLATLELGRRIATAKKGETVEITNRNEAYRVFQWMQGEKQEVFAAAYLNTKGHLIARQTVHIGTLDMSVVGAREVFREAVRQNAASVIVAHNHPSGDPTPSPEDITTTRRLQEVGELLDIPLLDHLIIGADTFVSLKERGVL